MISENGLVSSDVYFVSFPFIWTAGAWHIKSRSPLYNDLLRGYVREFPIAAKRELGNHNRRKHFIPKQLRLWFALRTPIPLPCCHSKVAVELLDRRACFPSDREIRGCRGPTGARRQIKQGGYPWSDTWSHFKGWERHWSPVISSERQSVRVKGGGEKKEAPSTRMVWVRSNETSPQCRGWLTLEHWRSDGAKSVLCWSCQVQHWCPVQESYVIVLI